MRDVHEGVAGDAGTLWGERGGRNGGFSSAGCLAMRDVLDGVAGDDDAGALAGHADAAGERIEADAGSVADGDPGNLIVAFDHPGGGVGGVVDLLEVVGGVHVDFGGVGVHLLALVGGGGAAVRAWSAVVLRVFEENAQVGAGEKVAGGEGPDAGLGGPLDEAVHEGGRELADGEGAVFDFDLAGEDGEGGRGLAVGGAEEETAEDEAVLHVDPDKGAAAEVRAALAGDEDVAVIANLDGDAGTGQDFVEGVGMSRP